MTTTPEDRSRLVEATVNRLRLVQGDLADDTPESRRELLAETIESAMARLVPAEREVFLQDLEAAFPSWDQNVRVSEEPAAPAASVADQRELKDPSFLVARLAELAPSLSDVQRRVLTDRLREAGLAPAGGGAQLPDEAVQRLKTSLQIKTGEPDAVRLVELAAVLAGLAAGLDQIVWSTWKAVAPRSAIRRPSPLLQSMNRFVVGGAEVGRAQVAQDAERLRALTAAMIAGVSQIGHQFAQNHLAKFSPAEITAAAGMEGGGLLTSKEVKCWRKYVELAGTMDETAIETEIKAVLAASVESFIRPGSTGQGPNRTEA